RVEARDFQSFNVRLNLSAPGAETPWGKLARGKLAARVFPATTKQLSRAELYLEADGAQTRWTTATNIQLTLCSAWVEGNTNVVHGDLVLFARAVSNQWGRAANPQFTAQWTQSVTNAIPLHGRGELRCAEAETQWG